jgi:hypothetical protein
LGERVRKNRNLSSQDHDLSGLGYLCWSGCIFVTTLIGISAGIFSLEKARKEKALNR